MAVNRLVRSTESGLLLASGAKRIDMKIQKSFWIIPFLCFILGYQITRFFLTIDGIETPGLVGLTVTEAVKILSKNSLNVRILSDKEDAELPDGTIVSQTPATGRRIKSNQSIFLSISKKPENPIAPQFVGKTLKDAENCTRKIVSHNKIYPIESCHPSGTCIAQHPHAGTALEDSKVLLYVSDKKRRSAILPSLVGRPPEEVIAFLDESGIPYEIVGQQKANLSKQRISDQRPLAGSFVEIDNPPTVQLQVI